MTNHALTEVGTVPPPAEREPPQDTNSLLALAIDKNVPVEILEKLVALDERVAARNARRAFMTALANFQDECPEVRTTKTASIKSDSGASFDYDYAPLETISRTIRPFLRKHGLSYKHTTAEAAKDATLIVSCIVRHEDGHEETSSFPVPVDQRSRATSAAQKNGGALTYGRRQTLLMALGLVAAGEDNDAAAAAYITPDQIKELNDLISALQFTETQYRRFLNFMQVDNLGEITVRDFDKGMRNLKEIQAKRSK